GRLGRQMQPSRLLSPPPFLLPAPENGRLALQRSRRLDSPAARLEGRTLEPTGPGTKEECHGQGSRHPAQPDVPPREPPSLLRRVAPRQEILKVPCQRRASHDRKEGADPHLKGAPDRQPEPGEEVLPAPVGAVEEERKQPQEQQGKVGDAGQALPEGCQIGF